MPYFAEGELEAEWLIAAGFPQLTKPFEQVHFLFIFFPFQFLFVYGIQIKFFLKRPNGNNIFQMENCHLKQCDCNYGKYD